VTDKSSCGIGSTLVVGQEIWSELEGACIVIHRRRMISVSRSARDPVI